MEKKKVAYIENKNPKIPQIENKVLNDSPFSNISTEKTGSNSNVKKDNTDQIPSKDIIKRSVEIENIEDYKLIPSDDISNNSSKLDEISSEILLATMKYMDLDSILNLMSCSLKLRLKCFEFLKMNNFVGEVQSLPLADLGFVNIKNKEELQDFINCSITGNIMRDSENIVKLFRLYCTMYKIDSSQIELLQPVFINSVVSSEIFAPSLKYSILKALVENAAKDGNLKLISYILNNHPGSAFVKDYKSIHFFFPKNIDEEMMSNFSFILKKYAYLLAELNKYKEIDELISEYKLVNQFIPPGLMKWDSDLCEFFSKITISFAKNGNYKYAHKFLEQVDRFSRGSDLGKCLNQCAMLAAEKGDINATISFLKKLSNFGEDSTPECAKVFLIKGKIKEAARILNEVYWSPISRYNAKNTVLEGQNQAVILKFTKYYNTL